MYEESVASSSTPSHPRSAVARRQSISAAARWSGGPTRQRGLSLVSLIFIGVVVIFLMVIGAKAVPAMTEYFAVDRAVQKVAGEGQTVRDIRNAFDRYATVDNITSISGRDLDITKDGERVIVSFSYQYSIPIMDNVRIVIDFAGSNRDHPGRNLQQ
jgi:hypothetical protein